MDIVQQAGAEIALPSQTTYLASDSSEKALLSIEARRAAAVGCN
jgi:hypothetical protein